MKMIDITLILNDNYLKRILIITSQCTVDQGVAMHLFHFICMYSRPYTSSVFCYYEPKKNFDIHFSMVQLL